MEELFYQQEIEALNGGMGRAHTRNYEDYFHTLSNREFVRNFRFSKEGVVRLTALVEHRLNEHREELRGRPRIPVFRQAASLYIKH